MMMVVDVFRDSAWSSASSRRRPIQRSKFDIGRADAGADGMSMTSGPGGASCVGASSSSSEASAMAHSTGSSGAGSGSMYLENRSSRGWSAAASVKASRNSPSLCARKRRHPVVHAWFFSQRSATARDAHSAEDWRRLALFMAKPSKEPSRTERARVALACAWMQLLKLRKTVTSQGCRYDVLRGGMSTARRQGKWPSWRWRGCWPCPREGSTPVPPRLDSARRQRVAASYRIVAVVAQPFSNGKWRVRPGQGCSGKTASVMPACTICTSMSSGPRSMLKATVNVVASFALPCT